jgi:hypothetical protein
MSLLFIPIKEQVMWKSASASLMCLGLASLGVAVSSGQEAKEFDVEEIQIITTGDGTVDVEGDIRFTETKPVTEAKLGDAVRTFELREGGEGGPSATLGFRVQVEDQDIVISTDDGKIIEKHRVGDAPHTARIAASKVLRGPQAIDPETRETLEKLLSGLREEAQRLEKEGKKDEAAQKSRSIHALERLLTGQTNGRVVYFTQGANPEELKKLLARRDELAKQLATKADFTDDGAAKLKDELAATESAIAEQKKQAEKTRHIYSGGFAKTPMAPGMMMPHPVPPGMSGGLGGMMAGSGGGMMPGAGRVRFFGHAQSEALSRKAEALSQAATKLKEAGLGEQAKQLADQAEKLKDEATMQAKREAEQMHAQGQGGFGGGFGGFGIAAGPPAELQRSIKELHEQVQLLRKEVAELREALQLKR